MTKPETDLYKLPRLYINADLTQDAQIALDMARVHYLRNVLRRQEGDYIRIFNGRDGEWLACLTKLAKKAGEAAAESCLRVQPDPGGRGEVHLYFSPIKKQRMDMLVEKAVELGVDGLHPVIMRRTVMRKINEERVRAQIIEAAEQCERMDIPVLYPVQNLEVVLSGMEGPLYACIERDAQARPLGDCDIRGDAAFLIGPEGGFDKDETDGLLACDKVVPVGLGESILRAETAALACLSWVRFMASPEEKNAGRSG